MITIKPKLPLLPILYGGGLITMSIFFYTSKNDDWKILVTGNFLSAVGFIMLWIVDYGYMVISYDTKYILFKGYFGLRKLELSFKEIEGYQIHEKVDQVSGFHKELQLVIRDRKKNLVIPTIAYNEESHKEIRGFCEAEFPFLGYTEFKYGRLIGKVLLIMFALTGILSSLVGIMKLMK